MAKFSISDIEKFTGIKAHTLRIWEQRYDLLTPKRTETKIRYYDDEDLKLLLNVSILMNSGYKISKISALGKETISSTVSKLSQTNTMFPTQIMNLCSAMLSVDEDAFNKIISTQILQTGLEDTMSDLIFPFLNHIGVLWMTGAIHPAHEHFITNLIKQKLCVAIDGQTNKLQTNPINFLLYLPEGENHEIGLLFANYILRSRGHKVVYLGQMTPEEDIVSVFDFYKPEYIFTSATSNINCQDNIKEFIESTSKLWKNTQVIMTGAQVISYNGKVPKNIKIIKTIKELTEYLTSIKKK
ncbi:MAG: MerR family transcriptional regulator [Bacteroidetes bacterium]|nr:MerR family transcriptional regulator [Bacteroidota bacterium]